ncbi:hypothetical protein JX265_011547 [Neoarthrinium moseri]|uniref:Uncharacterized protein n=1 Tax=Neoarthrinium moseri TaxID=1658444 RepID=A0A9Q0AJE1_9PEZI|nr:uncharacterized protein JN550_011703 [Neoarthrinium moseri]KAI1848599.1 hypothetical protein JX266_005458 [Neoarthrinium moseri]KAI1856588.1 hypothetical protein JX265_011547 [Neoarthrinium moseri]KAI1860019.1 hypothetical protein JN550_011703 [Neoarthrinium moseri]
MLYKIIRVLPFIAAASLASPLEPRANTDFTLFAYGPDSIGGFPVISIGIDAMSTRGNFTATMTDSSQSLLYIPSTSGQVGFTNTTGDSSLITTGFGFYGHVVFVQIGSTMETSWYAIPTSDSDIWVLTWDDDGDGAIPIALRNIAPS